MLWRNERDKPAGRQTHEWLDAFAIKAAATLDRLRRRRAHWKASRSGSGTSRSAVRSPIWIFASPISRGAMGRPRLAAWQATFAARPVGQGDGDRRWLSAAHPRNGPLTHIRVLDLGASWRRPGRRRFSPTSAPTSSVIERPGAGDDTRAWGPPFLRDRDGNADRRERLFLRSIAASDLSPSTSQTVEGQATDPRDGAAMRCRDREFQGRRAGEVRSRCGRCAG
mgnify:CR=1 FL=1